MNLQHGRMQTVGVVTRWLEHPALEPPAVRSVEVVLFRLSDIPVVQPGIEVRDPSFSPIGEHVELARMVRIRGTECQHAGCDIKVVDAPLPARLVAHVAIEIDRLDGGHAWAAGQEVDAVAPGRPADPGRMARAHVIDHAVADGPVEVQGQAARPAAVQRHDPQPLEQTDVEAVRRDEGDLVSPRRPDRRAEIKTPAEAESVGVEVDEVEVQLPLQIGPSFSIARDDETFAVGRPVEVGDVPGAAGQLLGVAADRGNGKQVAIAAIHVALAVVLVVQPAHYPRDRRTANLLTTFGQPWVVDHRFRIGKDAAGERDAGAVRRPQRTRYAFGQGRHLSCRRAGGQVEDEKLIRRAHLAQKCQLAAIRGPLRGVVSQRPARRFDRLGIEQAPDHDPAAVLP